MNAVYKYEYNGEIIYVGRSDNSVLSRVNSHKNEVKFKPYAEKAIVYYGECKNKGETFILETFLINKYKPVLNISMKYEEDLSLYIPEPEWHLLSELKKAEKPVKKAKTFKERGLQNRIDKIEALKRKIDNLDWMKLFIQPFYGMYDIEFTDDYSKENREKYERLLNPLTFCHNDKVTSYFNVVKAMEVSEKEIRISFMDSILKEYDFWNNYETIFQQTKEERLEEISKTICEIEEAGYEYKE